jgi:hypothetical protein
MIHFDDGDTGEFTMNEINSSVIAGIMKWTVAMPALQQEVENILAEGASSGLATVKQEKAVVAVKEEPLVAVKEEALVAVKDESFPSSPTRNGRKQQQQKKLAVTTTSNSAATKAEAGVEEAQAIPSVVASSKGKTESNSAVVKQEPEAIKTESLEIKSPTRNAAKKQQLSCATADSSTIKSDNSLSIGGVAAAEVLIAINQELPPRSESSRDRNEQVIH